MTRNKFKNGIRMRHQLVRNCRAICYLPKPTICWNEICIANCTTFCIDILCNLFGLAKTIDITIINVCFEFQNPIPCSNFGCNRCSMNLEWAEFRQSVILDHFSKINVTLFVKWNGSMKTALGKVTIWVLLLFRL